MCFIIVPQNLYILLSFYTYFLFISVFESFCWCIFRFADFLFTQSTDEPIKNIVISFRILLISSFLSWFSLKVSISLFTLCSYCSMWSIFSISAYSISTIGVLNSQFYNVSISHISVSASDTHPFFTDTDFCL
jgi:hypothetical protein